MTVQINFGEQDPTGEITYDLDFTAELARNAPLTITAVSWSVHPIDGDPMPLVISASSSAPDNSTAQVRIKLGTWGYTYIVSCSRVWSDGQKDVVSFTITIAYT